MKQAKNKWFQQKAKQIELVMLRGSSGREVWQGLREIQQGRVGLQQVKQRTIREVDGQLCMGLDETQCWQDHFEAVLNIRSSFIESATQAVHQHEVRDEINEPPTEDEIYEALSSLKQVVIMEFCLRW